MATFDEPKYVPLSKRPVQKERDVSAKKDAKILPFSPDEANRIRIDREFELEEPKAEFLTRLMVTQASGSGPTRPRLARVRRSSLKMVRFGILLLRTRRSLGASWRSPLPPYPFLRRIRR